MNNSIFASLNVGRRFARFLAILTAVTAICSARSIYAVDAAQPAPQVHAEAPAHEGAQAEHAGAHAAHHELSAYAVPLFYGFGGHPEIKHADGTVEPAKMGPFAFTNSMVLMFAVAALILISARRAMRGMKEVPDGRQNFWEFLVESLRNFLESIIGRDLTKRTFWFFASIFIFILATNWFGLLPGVGTIGWGPDYNHDGHPDFIDTPLLRGGNADLNMTLAMSMLFFLCWIYWALSTNGIGGFLMHIFGPKGKTKGFMRVLMIIVFALVGIIEVVSILFRPISLSFRLFGNVFAGENVLEAMANLVPALAPIIPIPFYFMELLVGLVQALVFMLLTAVFTLLICTHDDDHESQPHAH
jgi:F-type H+-transporting ATPase subunit a